MSLFFYTRSCCPLCDRLERLVAPSLAAAGLAYEKKLIDDDATLRNRFGHRVPVLTHGQDVLLEGRPESEQVKGVLAAFIRTKGQACR